MTATHPKAMPRVSIVIPTYNRADLLPITLDGVLNQTYRDLEVIVVDNASTDETPAMMARYCQNDPRIVYIRKPVNEGMIASYLTGYQHCTGEFFSALDSDDTNEPTRLEKQVAYLDAHQEVSLVYARFYNIDFDGQRLNKTWLMPDGYVLDQLLLTNFIYYGATLFRKAALDHIGGYDPNVQMDPDTNNLLRCALEGYRFGCIQEPLGSYRVHIQNTFKNVLKEEEALSLIYRQAFAHPKMPAATAAMKDRAYTAMYLWLTFGYYSTQNWVEGQRVLRAALTLNPSWRTDLTELLTALRALALSVRVFEPVKFIMDVVYHLPDEIALSAQQRNDLMGQVYFGQALRHYYTDEIDEAKREVDAAMRLSAELLEGGKMFEDILFPHALTIPDGSPRWFVSKVLENLPTYAYPLLRAQARLLSNISVLSAFGYYAAREYKHVPKEVVSAVSSRPGVLRNRGLLSICFKSMVAA